MGKTMKTIAKMRLLALAVLLGLVQIACDLTSTPTPSPQALAALPTATLAQAVTLELTVQTDPNTPYTAPGEVIKFNYLIKNTGTTFTPGPVSIAGITATCPELKTVGNLDPALDVNETLTCTATYTITQADLDKGSVANVVTANVNGINSNQVTTTLTSLQSLALKLTKTANPTSYDYVGQKITFTYVITNNTTGPLGPAQFVVSDPAVGTINCGAANLSLASAASVSCSVVYTVTQADMGAASVATGATASGAGMGPSQPVSATLTRSAAAANPGNLTPGSTIRHQVVSGEWLWQIARCYGADPQKVSEANPPTPGEISPGTTVIVPNIGSAGKIYGPPCVGMHTVQSGETWNSIAQKYNADATVLQMVNANTLSVGKVLKVPLNSAGGTAANPGTNPGSTAANCVDLIRNLKFVGLNTASPTHFNLCGPLDTSGKMKIATLKVYQRPEDVGQGGLSQDLTVSIETSTPMTDPGSLMIGDMNYDGNDDFRIIKNLPAGPNIPYLYYLFDPTTRKFVYSAAYEPITSPEFPGNSEIRSKWRESAEKWGIDTYKVTNNVPALTQRESWEAVNTTQALHRIMTFDAVGMMKVTVEETIPLPTQP
jgi:hypothetical protein